MMFKKILSYFYPVTVYETSSTISKTLEVTLYNGKTLLNTKNTNYSYGSLQKVLKKGLSEIGIHEIKKMNSILILGVAGGSVVKTLVEDFGFRNNITGVELDAEIIEIAHTHFNLDKFSNFNCIIDDAEQFVAVSKNSYDLILIDIFKDSEMPMFLFETNFINNIKKILESKGYILFNTMILDKNKKQIIEQYLQQFKDENYNIKILRNVEKFNDLVIVKKH